MTNSFLKDVGERGAKYAKEVLDKCTVQEIMKMDLYSLHEACNQRAFEEIKAEIKAEAHAEARRLDVANAVADGYPID